MTSFVGQRRAQLANQLPSGDPEGPDYKADLFTRLVTANETEVRLVLDDKELVSATDHAPLIYRLFELANPRSEIRLLSCLPAMVSNAYA